MDERLRDLERRWRETGDPIAGADWLRERVRTGELAPDRLLLAGCCGHEAARLAAELPEDWLEALERLDRQVTPWVAVRVGAAMARLCVGSTGWSSRLAPSAVLHDATEAVLLAVEACVRDPSLEHMKAAASSVPWQILLDDPLVQRKRKDVLPAWAVLVAWNLLDVIHMCRLDGPEIPHLTGPLRDLARAATRSRLPEEVDAVRSELVEWALGP